jgi:hypothetical protein
MMQPDAACETLSVYIFYHVHDSKMSFLLQSFPDEVTWRFGLLSFFPFIFKCNCWPRIFIELALCFSAFASPRFKAVL